MVKHKREDDALSSARSLAATSLPASLYEHCAQSRVQLARHGRAPLIFCPRSRAFSSSSPSILVIALGSRTSRAQKREAPVHSPRLHERDPVQRERDRQPVEERTARGGRAGTEILERRARDARKKCEGCCERGTRRGTLRVGERPRGGGRGGRAAARGRVSDGKNLEEATSSSGAPSGLGVARRRRQARLGRVPGGADRRRRRRRHGARPGRRRRRHARGRRRLLHRRRDARRRPGSGRTVARVAARGG